MAFEVSQLEIRIRAILQAPGVDLATISAKRVRKRLMEEDPSLTADVVKDNKDEIDKLIGTVYEEVSAAQQAGQDGGDEEGDEDDDEAEDSKLETASSSKPEKKRKKPRKADPESADAELARQLSSELNGRPRTAKRATAGKPKRGTKRKSAEVVDSDGEGEGVERPKKRGGGFSKEYTLSEPLAALLSQEKMSRPQVVKNLWVHIRGQNLQNPRDKREIICDDRLKAVFGVDKMNMFAMNKMLGQHLYEAES